MVTFDSTDLDNAVSESGVVHESTANTDYNDASVLQQGDSAANPLYSSSLVGYWPLQEDSGGTAYDFSGNNNDGTYVGAGPDATGTGDGLLGTTAPRFDGTDDYVSCGAVLDIGGQTAFSFSVWFATTTSGSQDAYMSTGAYDGAYIRLDEGTNNTDGGVVFKIDDGSNYLSFGTSSTYNDGSLHHAVLVNESDGLMRGYVDGSEEVSGTHSVGDLEDDVNFGRLGPDGYEKQWLDGRVADARVYSRALSSSEVQQLYDVVATSGTLQTQYKTQ